MLKGAGVTLSITFWAVLGGTLTGVAFGMARATVPWWINGPIGFVLDIFRSVPLLIQLILANSFKSIIGLNWSAFTIGCLVLAIYTGAFCTEIVRAGILAVPTTTRRAARSLGMNWRQDLTEIVFPMALRVALPNWISLTLGTMKDTALVLWIGIIELLRSSQIIVTRIQEPLFVLGIVGLIYFLMSFPIARLGARLEKRWREND
ncbi:MULTISPECIES: amino acid ABC transporter permease [unclassified Mesorhizobium]|uniref:amino acid ABC transporter permease n=1 Tax=unclassified Mesorhizobium TaxID=325217 RepID=UPI001092C0C4|nr:MULTISPECIES: amino acid ABC transporter permease [unclassified Mesorhizobium]TGS44023.1 amino acid ABC transporter permease [Mesorhizobium sp. M8A.F.Ca.ET.182.01.1.1]TGS78384.1 amino acid ABC transporter permease [Mesorhizobium sp. M8A.F.Ca.ET.181.01.1.1]TGV15554.1 amino acid ABC transporter permease [Mesorhizobium sp. M8A.F.Ca.ET.173.01.1.1]